MAEDKKSWWHTLPGVLTALAGVITAVATLIGMLNKIGVFEEKAGRQTSSTQVSVTESGPGGAVSAQTTDGWAIVGKLKNGRFYDLKLMVHEDTPAIGRRYDVVEDFRVVQKRYTNREEQGQVITLGKVQRGDSVEILDIYAKTPSSQAVPVWAKLRAALHQR